MAKHPGTDIPINRGEIGSSESDRWRGSEAEISAKPDHSSSGEGGLSDAQKKLAGLLEELTETVESADHLTRIGEPEEALRVVERQRARLLGTVDTISRAISTTNTEHPIRRNLVLLVAAVVLALSGIGISLASLTTKTDDPATHLHRAAAISDPVQRLNALYDVYSSTARANPAAIAVGTTMNKELKAAISKNADDLKSDPSEQPLVDKANEWVNDLETGAPLTPPEPPSGQTTPTPAPSPSTPAAPSPSTPEPPSTPKTPSVGASL